MSDQQGIERIFISVPEAAEVLSISRWSVYRLTKAGEIASAVFGEPPNQRRLVSVESIRAYADRLLGESA